MLHLEELRAYKYKVPVSYSTPVTYLPINSSFFICVYVLPHILLNFILIVLLYLPIVNIIYLPISSNISSNLFSVHNINFKPTIN